MQATVYVLATLICLTLAALLVRGYIRGRQRLLLWCSLCFTGLTLANALTFIDLIIYPEIDLFPFRLIVAAAAMLILVFGLVWELQA